MNKAQLIDAVAKAVGTKKEAQAAVDTVLDAITKSLKRGEPVTLIGFGTFRVRTRKARAARSPGTGEGLTIPARRIPVFQPGKRLRAAVGGPSGTGDGEP